MVVVVVVVAVAVGVVVGVAVVVVVAVVVAVAVGVGVGVEGVVGVTGVVWAGAEVAVNDAPHTWTEYLDAAGRLENPGGIERPSEKIDRDLAIVAEFAEWVERASSATPSTPAQRPPQ